MGWIENNPACQCEGGRTPDGNSIPHIKEMGWEGRDEGEWIGGGDRGNPSLIS